MEIIATTLRILLGMPRATSFGLIIPCTLSYGDCGGEQLVEFGMATCYGGKRAAWIHGGPSFSHEIHCCISPLRTVSNTSLSVFWFYRHIRPLFFDDFVGKQKGRYEGTNIIWSQSPGQVGQWMEKIDSP